MAILAGHCPLTGRHFGPYVCCWHFSSGDIDANWMLVVVVVVRLVLWFCDCHARAGKIPWTLLKTKEVIYLFIYLFIYFLWTFSVLCHVEKSLGPSIVTSSAYLWEVGNRMWLMKITVRIPQNPLTWRNAKFYRAQPGDTDLGVE